MQRINLNPRETRMKRFFLLSCAAALLFFVCLTRADTPDLVNPYITSYPFKSAVIHYTIKNEHIHGKTSQGEETLYVKGDRMAIVGDVKLVDAWGKVEDEKKTLYISTPEYIFMIDLIEKKGIKIDNPRKYAKSAYSDLSDKEKNIFHERMDKREIVSLDLPGLGKKTGEAALLGKKCDVYELAGEAKSGEPNSGSADSVSSKNWIWDKANIRLKTIKEGPGNSTELTAVKIEENIEISEERFQVPADIEVKYDETKSEYAKQKELSEFHLLLTGNPKPIKIKLKKEVLNPG